MRIEHGCDDPVSLTPPASVVAAAQLACRVTIDELTRDCTMPATLLDVIEPQEAPYDVRGIKSPANVTWTTRTRRQRVLAKGAGARGVPTHAARGEAHL
jgi:hypothetical protein